MITQKFTAFFPVFFVALWLTMTAVLGFLSGWFRLMAAYPDQPEAPLLRLHFQSGMMGSGVSMKGVLTLSACPSGLRVGMLRVFGPWSRTFFVPWTSIAIVSQRGFFEPAARLEFGVPAVGRLSVSARVATRLARASMGRWPEPEFPPPESRRDLVRRVLGQWAVSTGIAALFFTCAPKVLGARDAGPPVTVAILLPAIVFGLGAIVSFFYQKS